MKNLILLVSQYDGSANNSQSPIGMILFVLLCLFSCYIVFKQKKKANIRLEILTEEFTSYPLAIEIADDVIKQFERIIKSAQTSTQTGSKHFEVNFFINDREVNVDGSVKCRYLIETEMVGRLQTKEEREAFIRAIIVMVKNGLSCYEKSGINMSIENETGKTIKYTLSGFIENC